MNCGETSWKGALIVYLFKSLDRNWFLMCEASEASLHLARFRGTKVPLTVWGIVRDWRPRTIYQRGRMWSFLKITHTTTVVYRTTRIHHIRQVVRKLRSVEFRVVGRKKIAVESVRGETTNDILFKLLGFYWWAIRFPLLDVAVAFCQCWWVFPVVVSHIWESFSFYGL